MTSLWVELASKKHAAVLLSQLDATESELTDGTNRAPAVMSVKNLLLVPGLLRRSRALLAERNFKKATALLARALGVVLLMSERKARDEKTQRTVEEQLELLDLLLDLSLSSLHSHDYTVCLEATDRALDLLGAEERLSGNDLSKFATLAQAASTAIDATEFESDAESEGKERSPSLGSPLDTSPGEPSSDRFHLASQPSFASHSPSESRTPRAPTAPGIPKLRSKVEFHDAHVGETPTARTTSSRSLAALKLRSRTVGALEGPPRAPSPDASPDAASTGRSVSQLRSAKTGVFSSGDTPSESGTGRHAVKHRKRRSIKDLAASAEAEEKQPNEAQEQAEQAAAKAESDAARAEAEEEERRAAEAEHSAHHADLRRRRGSLLAKPEDEAEDASDAGDALAEQAEKQRSARARTIGELRLRRHAALVHLGRDEAESALRGSHELGDPVYSRTVQRMHRFQASVSVQYETIGFGPRVRRCL